MAPANIQQGTRVCSEEGQRTSPFSEGAQLLRAGAEEPAKRGLRAEPPGLPGEPGPLAVYGEGALRLHGAEPDGCSGGGSQLVSHWSPQPLRRARRLWLFVYVGGLFQGLFRRARRPGDTAANCWASCGLVAACCSAVVK